VLMLQQQQGEGRRRCIQQTQMFRPPPAAKTSSSNSSMCSRWATSRGRSRSRCKQHTACWMVRTLQQQQQQEEEEEEVPLHLSRPTRAVRPPAGISCCLGRQQQLGAHRRVPHRRPSSSRDSSNSRDSSARGACSSSSRCPGVPAPHLLLVHPWASAPPLPLLWRRAHPSPTPSSSSSTRGDSAQHQPKTLLLVPRVTPPRHRVTPGHPPSPTTCASWHTAWGAPARSCTC
jgi:hypothetical protein